MSQWTHVSGCIRVDGMPQIIPLSDPSHDITGALGIPSSNDWLPGRRYREAKDIPGGSEGSIQYAITDAGNGLVWKTVAIWGDLRDFGIEDTPQIDAWFARIVDSPLMLRAAALLVEIEGNSSYLLLAEGKGTVRRIELIPASRHG